MVDLLMDPCGDLDIANGRVSLVRGADAVRQRWLIYIRTYLGEWFLDQNIGVPYTQEVFRKQISRQTLKQIFTTASLEVPGILQVASVIVDELNVATRFAEITVNCVIDGAEGPENGQFRYTGTIPPEGCDPLSNVPPTIPGLLTWFDASDAASYVQSVGSSLVMQNKAGAGTLSGVSSGAVPHVSLSSPLNNRPSVETKSKANVDHLAMAGVPALRDTTGYDGSFTIFEVSRLKSAGQSAGDPENLWALDGVEATGVTREWYNGRSFISTPAFGSGGNGGLGLLSRRLGFAGLTYSAIPGAGGITPPLVDDAPQVRCWGRDFSTSPAPRGLWVNGYPFDVSADDDSPRKRLLNGAGVIGASYDVAGVVAGSTLFYWGEWLMWGRMLSDAERNAVFDYLFAKWAIPRST